MRTMKSDAQFHVNESARAARAAHARMMRGDLVPLFLYYRPRRLEAFPQGEAPDLSWTLAIAEPLPSDLTADQLVYWFACRTASIPYLVDE